MPERANPWAAVWIMVVRGVMAIVLGLALALSRDRAPSALVNFMRVYWLLAGVVSLRWGWRRSDHGAGCRS